MRQAPAELAAAPIEPTRPKPLESHDGSRQSRILFVDSESSDSTRVESFKEKTTKITVELLMIELPSEWDKKRDEMEKILKAYYSATRRDAGCLRCDVMRMQGKGNTDAKPDAGASFVIYRAYESPDDELASRETGHFKEWNVQLEAIKSAGGKCRSFTAYGHNFSTASKRLPSKQMKDGACAIVVQTEVKPGYGDELLKIMGEVAKESRREDGCLRYDLLSGTEPNTFCFYEVYESEDAFQAHKQTVHCKAWGKFK